MRPTRHGSTTRRLRAAAAVLLLGALVAGCSGGSESMEADSGGASAAQDGIAGLSRESLSTDAGGADSARAPAARAVAQTRAVIRTGRVSVVSPDLDELRGQVDDLLLTVGGTIDNEQTSHNRKGEVERSVLLLRVPVDEFAAVMTALEDLGTIRSSDSTSKDVTTEVIDVEERVQTLQNSLDRLQRFQRAATNIDDLIAFEDQITEREQELSSLQAQQAYLADKTSMATISLSLLLPEKVVAPPGPLDDAGFLAGLRNGWEALEDAVVVSLTVVGAVLPFAVVLALVGVPVWLLVRSTARRRTATAVPAGPAGPAEPADRD